MKLRTDIHAVTLDGAIDTITEGGSPITVPVERYEQVLVIKLGPDPGQVLLLKADELCEFLIRSKPNNRIQ